MAGKENLPPRTATPPISRISPSNKPALGRQRDHSACRAADTPLKVKKTRENLRQTGGYVHDIPPPCLHAPHIHHEHRFCTAADGSTSLTDAHVNAARDPASDVVVARPQLLPEQQQGQQQQQHPQTSLQASPAIQRQKSVSRRMLSRVKQGIAGKSKSSQSVRPTGSETSLARRLSGRRKPSSDAERRSQSFELSRDSIESTIDEVSAVNNGAPPLVQRSFTDSTVSTSEILDDLASVQVPSFHVTCPGATTDSCPSTARSVSSSVRSSPSPHPTPRPLRQPGGSLHRNVDSEICLEVPCIDLKVTFDCESVDVNSKRDVWIAIDAAVQLRTTTRTCSRPSFESEELQSTALVHDTLHSTAENLQTSTLRCGTIDSLRLCYKAADGCRIRNIIGRKSYKDLAIGQQCTLFVKVSVPRLQTVGDGTEQDQDSLFAELESIVGILNTDILHIEARYRHSLLPLDNVVVLKQTCKLLRPKTESRWSIVDLYDKEDRGDEVQTRLAQYLAIHYAPDEALELLHRYVDHDSKARPGVAGICSMLQASGSQQQYRGADVQQPAVVITDIDLDTGVVPDPVTEHYETAPSTPREAGTTANVSAPDQSHTGSPNSLTLSRLALPSISIPKTSTAYTPAALVSSSPASSETHETHDSAHQLWRHIRRTSLSARQLEQMTPERLSTLEAGDDSLKELRRKAIANKRSIGAETLRAWKWEADMRTRDKPVEAPWM